MILTFQDESAVRQRNILPQNRCKQDIHIQKNVIYIRCTVTELKVNVLTKA